VTGGERVAPPADTRSGGDVERAYRGGLGLLTPAAGAVFDPSADRDRQRPDEQRRRGAEGRDGQRFSIAT